MTQCKAYVSVAEAARRLGVSRPTVYAWIKLGLPVERIGGRWLVSVATLDKWHSKRKELAHDSEKRS